LNIFDAMAWANIVEEINVWTLTSLRWARGFVSPKESIEIAASESQNFPKIKFSSAVTARVVTVIVVGRVTLDSRVRMLLRAGPRLLVAPSGHWRTSAIAPLIREKQTSAS
jgi:hypothetical protein